MIKTFCDICGQEFKDYSEIQRYKIKKEWSDWTDHGWENLDVHEDCWKTMCRLVKSRQEGQKFEKENR